MTTKNEILALLGGMIAPLTGEERERGYEIGSKSYPIELYLPVSKSFRKEMLSKMGILEKYKYYLDSDFTIKGDFEVGGAYLSVSYWKGNPEMLIPGMPNIVRSELEKGGFEVRNEHVYMSDFDKIYGNKSSEPEHVAENVEFLKKLHDRITEVYKKECKKTRVMFENKI